MRGIVIGVMAASAATGAAWAQSGLGEAELEREARRIHDRVITLDTHVDIGLDYATHTNDPGGFSENQVDLPKMRAGGLDAAFFIVYTPQGDLSEVGYAAALEIAETRMSGIERMVAAYPDQVELALRARDVRRIHRAGKRVALIGMENAFPLGPTIEHVELWRDRGVRYMGITHFGHNQFGDSSNPNFQRDAGPSHFGGLSDLGRDLIRELNRVGVMIDVSHAGRATMLDAIELSEAPVIASHSGARALASHPRGLDDEQLRILGQSGGVAQTVALSRYVRDYLPEIEAKRAAVRAKHGFETDDDASRLTGEAREAYNEEMEQAVAEATTATVSDFIDHIDHIVAVAGVDHVGIASDFDGGGGIDGWEDASATLNVTKELVRRGYSEEDIAKIWGGNLLRVMREVEATAARLSR